MFIAGSLGCAALIFYGEMFTTQVRLSGMAIGTHIGFAIAGFSPTIAAALDGEDGTNWVPVAVLTAVFCLVNVVAVASARETYRVPTEHLGGTPAGPPAAKPVAA